MGPNGPSRVLGIFLVLRVLTKKNFRLLKHPKRLGLGQKVPGKRPLGPIEPPFMSPKKHRSPKKTKMGQKWQFWQKKFRVFAIKWAKQGVFFIVGYI